MADYNGRRLDFRFPSKEARNRFHEEALKLGCTDCKLVMHIIDEYFHRDAPRPAASPQDLQALREEVARLSVALRESNRLTAVQDELIQSLRNRAVLQDIPLDDRLIEALRSGPISSQMLLDRLGISMSNGEAIQAISRQLEVLEANGRISNTRQGWIWKA